MLFAHFKKLQLDLSIVTSNWLMTLFNGYLSYPVVLAVMDNFFLDGWSAIYRVSIAILKLYQEEFLKLPDMSFVAQKVQKIREETFKSLKPH